MPSRWIDDTVRCPQCHQASPFRRCEWIDFQSDPRLKESLLDESLFFWRCPACGFASRAYYALTCYDPSKAYCIRLDQEQRSDTCPAHDAPPDILHFRLVRSGQELQEKIRIFDALCFDGSMECLKRLLGAQLPDPQTPLVFQQLDGDTLLFSQDQADGDVAIYTAPLASYLSLDQSVQALWAQSAPPAQAFIHLGPAWAEMCLRALSRFRGAEPQ